ncbi:MAG: exosortase/archaeosortase family protein [Phycisphaerales bacterium]
MTTATSHSGTTPTAAGNASLPQRTLLGAVSRPENLVKAGLLAGVFGAYFWNWLRTQARHSAGDSNWSHSFFVPLISGYLIWQAREAMMKERVGAYWPGLAPMLLGVVSYPFFVVGIPNHMAQGYAMILTLFGMVLVLLGPGMMRHLFLPIAYLVFMVTISEKILQVITTRLQQWAAIGGDVLLQIVGVNVKRSGVTLDIVDSTGATHSLDVAQTCAGMSMVIAFIALGAAVALVGCRYWWQRVVLVLLAMPVAVLLNVARIAVLGMLTLWDPDLATGQAHTLIGTLLLIPGFLVYMGIVWALNRAVRE